MIYNIKQLIIILLCIFKSILCVKLAEECYDTCNSFKRQVLTLEMCREAKKSLPRPKIGDFCTRAMEDGFKDACYSLCQGKEPIPKIAQACRAAAMELPRPTVRKWCEHGYRQGFKATMDSLTSYFRNSIEQESEYIHSQTETNIETHSENNHNNHNHNNDEHNEKHENEKHESTIIETESSNNNHNNNNNHESSGSNSETIHSSLNEIENNENNNFTLKKSIPITLDDNTYQLNLYEEQSPEDSVALFCSKYMSEDIAGCIRQLLPVVFEE